MKTKHFIDNIDVSECQYFVNMNCGEPAELCSCNKDMYGFNTDCRIAECNKNCYFKQLQKMTKIANKALDDKNRLLDKLNKYLNQKKLALKSGVIL